MCERAGVVRPIRHSGAPGPITDGDDNDDRAGTGAEDATRAIRFTGCTDCAFPDPLLATTLAASTYPLEIIQLQQWMERNKNLKDKALADAVAKQPWDPSVQSLAVTPDVVQRLAGNIQWTTDLGNAFLAQQSDVMDAVQRMRAKAQGTGNLQTSAQQTVETKT